MSAGCTTGPTASKSRVSVWQRSWLFVVLTLFIFVGAGALSLVAFLYSNVSTVQRIALICTVGLAIAAATGILTSKVEASNRGLTIRTMFYRRRIPWADVKEVRVASADQPDWTWITTPNFHKQWRHAIWIEADGYQGRPFASWRLSSEPVESGFVVPLNLEAEERLIAFGQAAIEQSRG